jgi:hypothetical protein
LLNGVEPPERLEGVARAVEPVDREIAE